MSYRSWSDGEYEFYLFVDTLYVRDGRYLFRGTIPDLPKDEYEYIWVTEEIYRDPYYQEDLIGLKVKANGDINGDIHRIEEKVREEDLQKKIWVTLEDLSEKAEELMEIVTKRDSESERLIKILKEQPQLYDLVKKVDEEQEKANQTKEKLDEAQKKITNLEEALKVLKEDYTKLLEEKRCLKDQVKTYKDERSSFKADLLRKLSQVLQ